MWPHILTPATYMRTYLTYISHMSTYCAYMWNIWLFRTGRYIANYISARIFMYVHNIFSNELYVMPLCPFHYLNFFILFFDQYNCGRWEPFNVADMLELQSTDPETWKFLDEGNFSITKHSVPFTAIDPDHGIEQEHKKMKVKGGYIGITGKSMPWKSTSL